MCRVDITKYITNNNNRIFYTTSKLFALYTTDTKFNEINVILELIIIQNIIVLWCTLCTPKMCI